METKNYINPKVTVYGIVSEGILCNSDPKSEFDTLQGTENIGNGGEIEL